jgi:hypothetical protein
MDAPTVKKQIAWQPLTARGVAAFASAALGRLLLVQFVIALLASATVVWFLHRAWYPVIDEAVAQLPEQGEIVYGRLEWRGKSPILLAEGHFLAFSVDLEHRGGARSPAQVQVEFGRTDVQVSSLFGFERIAYPLTLAVGFNHIEVGPWWGAWAPALLGIVAGLVIVGLMATWAILATAYCWIVWLVASGANRRLTWRGSWRLAGAALMPGALLLTGAIISYGLGAMDFLKFALVVVAHFVVGWIYLVLCPLSLPQTAVEVVPANPFGMPPSPLDSTKK